MHAPIGESVQPEAGRRVDGGQFGGVQAIEEALFDISHIVLDPPLGLGLANSTGLGREAMMGGEVQISFMEEGGLADGMSEDRGFQIIAEDLGGDAAEIEQGVLQAVQEMLQRLGQGELQVHQATVTEGDDQKAQTSQGLADGDHSGMPPVNLGALSRRIMQRQISPRSDRTHEAQVLLQNRIAARITLFPQALEDLPGAEGMLFDPSSDHVFERR